MLGLAPDVRILDVGHEIPAHDVRAGALLLVRAVQYLPDDCVVVAVVDPGVGTEPAARRRRGRPAACCSAPTTACSPRRWRWPAAPAPWSRSTTPTTSCPRPGPTFAGRDVLAPAAGHLAAGVPLAELGTPGRPGHAGARPGVAARGARRRRRSSARCGGSTGSATASSTSTPTSSAPAAPAGRPGRGARWAARSAPPGGCTPTPTPSRRSWCCWSTPTGCWRWRSTASRPPPTLGCKAGSGVTLVPGGPRR